MGSKSREIDGTGLSRCRSYVIEKQVSKFKTQNEKLAPVHVLIIQFPAYAPPTVTDKFVPTSNILQRYEGV